MAFIASHGGSFISRRGCNSSGGSSARSSASANKLQCASVRRSVAMCSNASQGGGKAGGMELEQRVRASLAEDGVDYDLLLNAPKVMKLYQELEVLQLDTQADSGEQQRVRREYERERRNVMRTGLKRVFEIQAVISAIIGGALAFNVGGDIELVYRALGFWTVWLFTVPSLRARKGLRTFEKSALNVGFLAIPFVNVGLAGITRETGVIWGADMLLLVALYLYYGIRSVDSDGKKEEGRVTGVLRYLDWGSWR